MPNETVRFGQLFNKQCRRGYVRAHDTIQNAVGGYLQSLGFEVVYEWKDEDADSSYRYDIIAQLKDELWVVEIKDVIDIRNFGQLEAYCLQLKKENPKAKVWLGTDCLNYWDLTNGETGQMTERLMKKEKMGVILINPKRVWNCPTHNELLNIEEKGHLCEDCPYCKGFVMSGAVRKILLAVESGYSKGPRITKNDYNETYVLDMDAFKSVKKECVELKKSLGKREFENKTEIKLEV